MGIPTIYRTPDGSFAPGDTALASAKLIVGNSSGVGAAVDMSGDATIANTGALTIAANAVEASMLGTNLGKGHIPLSLWTARIISGDAIQNTTEAGVPDGNTAGPSLARVNAATDKMVRLVWAANEVNELQFETFAYPGDLDDTAALTVHLLAAMSGATNTPTIAVSYWENTGDTNAGGNTGAITGTTITEYTVSIAAGDVGAHPKAAAISLIPAAHANDAIHVYAAWVEYTRKS